MKIDCRNLWNVARLAAVLAALACMASSGTAQVVVTPLHKDGLYKIREKVAWEVKGDNLKQGKQDKASILIVDGAAGEGRKSGGDSFFVKAAIDAFAKQAPYELAFGDELAKGDAAKALERNDLAKFKSIYLLNITEVTSAQAEKLEKYVEAGGGVVFFLGPKVSSRAYNKNLYKDGKGIFPAPLKETFYPPAGKPPLSTDFTGNYHFWLRDDLLPEGKRLPIFGELFDNPKLLDFLKHLPVQRYYPVDRSKWKPDPKRCLEVATLPNQSPATDFHKAASEFLSKVKSLVVGDQDLQKKYARGLLGHERAILSKTEANSKAKATELAKVLEAWLNDEGKEKEHEAFPNWKEFWANADVKIRDLNKELRELVAQTRYGDPLIIASSSGKGRVVTILTTAATEWNAWASGVGGAVLYAPMIYELQRYVSGEAGMDSGKK